MRFANICTAAALALGLSGCSTLKPSEGRDLGTTFYLAAEKLAERSIEKIAPDRPLLVATMVSVDDFGKSMSFGKLASQMIASRLAQHGFIVRDITYTHAIAISPETGEVVLSREANQISHELNAQAIVAGTFAVAGEEIWLNVRMIRAEDGLILSSVDAEIPLNLNTKPLLTAAR